jgi:23S rRNA (guanosine2251-2'-O)-methyltransferase
MSPRKATTLGSHNRSWIWGGHVVLETLRAGVWRPIEVAITPRCGEKQTEIRRLVERHGLMLQETTDIALTRRCRAEDHQGLAAAMPPFPYASFDELLARRPGLTAWLVLDRLQDSFNFGAIVRSAHALGIEAVVIGSSEQAEVNSQVVRSSAGAVNWLPIARVERLTDTLKALREIGVRPVAATEKASAVIDQGDLRGPAAVVIGNEGRGIQAEILRQCSLQVRIPMSGRVGSLNAAVAAGILCYELSRQRRQKDLP